MGALESERFAFEDSFNNTDWYLRNSWLWTFPKYATVERVGKADSRRGGADDMFDDNIFFLIKMPLESGEISRVNVEGDNINLTAAVVDSFDVAVERQPHGERWRSKRRKRKKKKKKER